MNNPRILVAVPYHEKKRYCLNELFNFIDSITYKNKQVVIRFDPTQYGGKNSCKIQREYFRRLALDQDADYLYFLGADTIPPKDVIERLLAHGKNIAGGVYWGRANADNGNTGSAVAWVNDMTPEKQKEMFLQEGSLVTVDGMGMDCVLISREVLEKISFTDWEVNDDDYPFYDIARSMGYNVYLDTSIQCKHYFGEDTLLGYSEKAKSHLTINSFIA